MPFEVRELVIRANVERSNPQNTTRAPSGNSTATRSSGGSNSTSEFETLKKMIEDKNER